MMVKKKNIIYVTIQKISQFKNFTNMYRLQVSQVYKMLVNYSSNILQCIMDAYIHAKSGYLWDIKQYQKNSV